MNSPNIKHIPLNREGALELGINPCSVCNSGWATYSNMGGDSCQNDCEYLRKFLNKKELELIKLKD